MRPSPLGLVLGMWLGSMHDAYGQATQAQMQTMIQQNITSGNPSAFTSAKLRQVLNAMLMSLPQPTPVATANLPTCNANLQGAVANVTDSSVTTWGSTVSGGGSNPVLVYCDGANWDVTAK